MQRHQKIDHIKLESNAVNKFQLQRFQGTFGTINSRNRPVGLHLAVLHNELSSIGVQIYWSRKNKYPSEEDCEGCFNAVNTDFPQVLTQPIQLYGETQRFACDHVYLGIYSMMPEVEVQLAFSFSVPNLKKQNTVKSPIKDEDPKKKNDKKDDRKCKEAPPLCATILGALLARQPLG